MAKSKSKTRFKISIIGCGNVGGSLIDGLLDRDSVRPGEIIACDNDSVKLKELGKKYSIGTTEDPAVAFDSADVVVFAVKPKDMAATMRTASRRGGSPSKIVISVAVGFSLSQMAHALRKRFRIVRAIPNITMSVGLGMTSVYSEDSAAAERALEIFGTVGLAIPVSNEELINAAAAISGSGPAFIYLVMDALVDGGVKMGLPRKDAELLVMQTTLGAAGLALESSESPSRLRESVITPGGTTIAGLFELERSAVRAAFISAVEKTTLRSIEIQNKLEGGK